MQGFTTDNPAEKRDLLVALPTTDGEGLMYEAFDVEPGTVHAVIFLLGQRRVLKTRPRVASLRDYWP